MASVSLEDVTQGLRACFKVLSKIQMPVAYMDMEAGPQTEEMELLALEEEIRNAQVCEVCRSSRSCCPRGGEKLTYL